MEKLEKKIVIEGVIEALSGIHIGGTNSAMTIGGMDSPVIRNPIDNKPYIPGSSLKGKIRSLIEIFDGTIRDARMGSVKYSASYDKDAVSAILFGTASNDEYQRPSRVIFRDGELISDEAIFTNTDLPFTEAKTEVVIDRITSKAMPRQIERVPSGAEFRLSIVINVFEKDDEKMLIKNLMRGLKLLQDDYIGGSGSRGSGQIKINIQKMAGRKTAYYLNEEEETDLLNEYKEMIKEFELC